MIIKVTIKGYDAYIKDIIDVAGKYEIVLTATIEDAKYYYGSRANDMVNELSRFSKFENYKFDILK